MPVRVLVVDDHPIVRQGLRMYLGLDPEIQIVGEAADGQQALGMAERLRPDVVVMDVLMPRMDGIVATGLVRRQQREVKILILTSASQDGLMRDAMAAGADGVLLKDVDVQELRTAIHAVSSGQVYLSKKLADRLIDELGSDSRSPSLTAREAQILELLAEGYSNKEIATSLQISLATVKTHVSTVLSKMGVASRTQAALHARQIAAS